MDASVSHFKSEKLKEINATSEYVPAICRTVGMKLQAVPEVTKSSGFQTLDNELTEAIQATRRDWATRFVLPVFDMNVKAQRRRSQLSFCRLLLSAAMIHRPSWDRGIRRHRRRHGLTIHAR